MRGRPIGRVEDFTIPFLVTFYILLLIALITIWAMSDFIVALLFAFAIHVFLARKLVARRMISPPTGH